MRRQLCTLVALVASASSFVPSVTRSTFSPLHLSRGRPASTSARMMAGGGGKGFGKPAPAPAPAPKSGSAPTPLDISVGSKPTASSAVPMTPPEAGNWPAPPASAPPSAARVALDDSMTEDERQDEILRSFGLTKASERSEKAAAEAAAKGPKVNAQGQWSEEPAFIAEDGGINFLALIPAPLQVSDSVFCRWERERERGGGSSRVPIFACASPRRADRPLLYLPQGPIESFLYTSTGVLLSAFIVAGLAITVDAYYVSVKEPLPDTLANLIVDVIEPNFTNAG